MKPFALQLYELGYTPLVSVIPPNAQLSPDSQITASQLGKTPGRKRPNGTWAGYGWLRHVATADDVKQWAQDGANIGLLAERFPAVDVDCTDPTLAAEITGLAQRVLGAAPVRVGKAPKSLLMYRLEGAPFSRMALLIFPEGKGPQKPSHLVEVLGAGRQYLVHGTHPTGVPYTWDTDLPAADGLTALSREAVERFFTELQELLEIIPGCEVERVGDGRARNAEDAPSQDRLRAPSLELLEEAVRFIPNNTETTREQYVRIGYAIRASWPDDEEEAFRIFADWAGKHEGSDRVAGNPETWRNDWRRMRPPYMAGYGWLAEVARASGFNDAQRDFEAVDAATERRAEEELGAAALSDKWCAHRVVEEHGHRIRYVAAEDRWYVWDMGRWRPDAVNLAMHLTSLTLERLSGWLMQQGATPQEKREATTQARRLASAYTRDAVLKLVETDPRVVIRPEAFDADPWLLNTPAGILDLRTGQLGPHDPAALCARMTGVAPDNDLPCPNWTRFLVEATGGDVAMIGYLQRFAGYCLTGSTKEQIFAMIWGPGGNGKSVFLNALMGVLGDYARTAPMDTFIASHGDRHPTELAMLMGARLVTANETQAGRRWDEARVKSLTGGDPVTARFMRQDFFTYLPSFKLVFVGNHKPELMVVDKAMQRRIHIVPFTVTPERVDTELAAKLRTEAAAVLAWAVRGCREWQERGLCTPPSVADATQEYFTEQDAVARWMEEHTREVPGAFASSEDLFESWREWAGRNGEYAGKMRAFVQRLIGKKIPKARHPTSRRHGFEGLEVVHTIHLTGDA